MLDAIQHAHALEVQHRRAASDTLGEYTMLLASVPWVAGFFTVNVNCPTMGSQISLRISGWPRLQVVANVAGLAEASR